MWVRMTLGGILHKPMQISLRRLRARYGNCGRGKLGYKDGPLPAVHLDRLCMLQT